MDTQLVEQGGATAASLWQSGLLQGTMSLALGLAMLLLSSFTVN